MVGRNIDARVGGSFYTKNDCNHFIHFHIACQCYNCFDSMYCMYVHLRKSSFLLHFDITCDVNVWCYHVMHFNNVWCYSPPRKGQSHNVHPILAPDMGKFARKHTHHITTEKNSSIIPVRVNGFFASEFASEHARDTMRACPCKWLQTGAMSRDLCHKDDK